MRKIPLPIIHHPIATYQTPNGKVFTLMSGEYREDDPRFGYSIWDVVYDGKKVASLGSGYLYGPGKFHGSMSPVRTVSGVPGIRILDHMMHDFGPYDTIERALQVAAVKAEYLLHAWAEKGGDSGWGRFARDKGFTGTLNPRGETTVDYKAHRKPRKTVVTKRKVK